MFVEIILSINPYYKIGEGAADCENGSPLGQNSKKRERAAENGVFKEKLAVAPENLAKIMVEAANLLFFRTTFAGHITVMV